MGTAGDLALALAGVLAVLLAPLEASFAVLVAFWLLVPGTLVVPHAPHVLLADRVVLYAFALRLVLRHGRPGEPARRAYRLGAVHAALGALLLVGFLDGVALAPPQVSVAGDLHAWLYLLDLAVLFVVVLAVARTLGLWRTVRPVLGALAVVVVIGVAERLTGHGWSHFFFEHLPAGYLAPGADPLQLRGGHVRAQAAAQFALEYGWVLAALLPLGVWGAVRAGRRRPALAAISWLLPAGMLAGVVLSGSRSATIAAVVGGLLFAVVSGADRRLLTVGLWVGAAALLVVLVDPSLVTGPFSTAAATDPASVRLDRLPELFSLAAHRPFVGVGLDGLAGTFGGTDDAYALLYATVGVLGLLAWVSLLVTAAAPSAGALRGRRGSDERALGAACLVGVLLVAVACASYDLVSTLQSEWALVVLAALGTRAAEALPARAPARRRWALRAVLPVYGVIFGTALALAAPVTASQSLSVLLVAPYVSAERSGAPDVYGGTTLVDTLCAAVTAPQAALPHTQVSCDQATNYFPDNPASLALVTVRASSAAGVRAETRHAFAAIFDYMPLAGGPSSPVEYGKPAWAVSAPLWAGLAGALAMLLLPPSRRRRPAPGSFRADPLAPAAPPRPADEQVPRLLTPVG